MRVLIAGGGVAGLEAALALRALAGERLTVELLAPETHFWYRPLAVVEPFGLGRVRGVELVDLCAHAGALFTLGALGSVDPERHVATTTAGVQIEYDVLVVASGARADGAVEGAFTFRGPADSDAYRSLVTGMLAPWPGRRLVLTAPGGASWPLPLYELALLTAAFVAERDAALDLALVTPEPAPLEIFGPTVGTVVADLLERAGVSVLTATEPSAARAGRLVLARGGSVPADRVVALPRIVGAPVAGLPHDDGGFIPADAHGRVDGARDVFAAGDATAFPVKQGGLAAAQADAVAEAIAAEAGAAVVPRPFRPVLRGLLVTGGAPVYLRAELGAEGEAASVATTEPLWWPPGKIAGKHLAPFLAGWAGHVLSRPAGAVAEP